jgi:hypothetical protein
MLRRRLLRHGQFRRFAFGGLDAAQVGLLDFDVAARERDRVLPLRDLHPEGHHTLIAQSQFRDAEIEFPQAREALVEEIDCGCAAREEALPPMPERLGLVQVQDLDIGDDEARAFDGGEDFGNRGLYPPGKMYLAIHGVVNPGPSERPLE